MWYSDSRLVQPNSAIGAKFWHWLQWWNSHSWNIHPKLSVALCWIVLKYPEPVLHIPSLGDYIWCHLKLLHSAFEYSVRSNDFAKQKLLLAIPCVLESAWCDCPQSDPCGGAPQPPRTGRVTVKCTFHVDDGSKQGLRKLCREGLVLYDSLWILPSS